MLKYRMVVFVCIAVMIMTGIAYAQTLRKNPGDPQLDGHGVPYTNRYWKGYSSSNVMALVRKPELTEDQFVLRITDPHPLSGCFEISNYAFETEYRDIYLDIKLDGAIFDMRGQPQYAHYQCNQGMQVPTADIVMNLSDLKKNETQQIRLHNGNDTNYYNIEIYENKVVLLPDEADRALAQRFKPHSLQARKTTMVYWFYPVGTVILWIPGMEAGPEMVRNLSEFAKNKSLMPLETVFPDFESPLSNSKYMYFVDTAGTFVQDDPQLAYGKAVGNITGKKLIYGLEKDEYEPYEITVYGKTPGMYD